jgi:hypothetical protein
VRGSKLSGACRVELSQGIGHSMKPLGPVCSVGTVEARKTRSARSDAKGAKRSGKRPMILPENPGKKSEQ